jgi:hypothetical protein
LPAALLVYRPDAPNRAVFYPFADFSPEAAALRSALERRIPVAFMDLPRRHTLATEIAAAMPPIQPFRQLAEAAGHEQYETWWNLTVEQGCGGDDLFAAVLEMAATMRRSVEAGPPDDQPGALLARQREAAMRQRLRQAMADGHQRVAAICGAWHAPALVDAHYASDAADEALLAGLPAVAVEAAWVPWTYGRMTQAGGYGAGIASPGWYDHLWTALREGLTPEQMSARWLARAAALLREEGLDTSAGHVIETVRLAEALAALRGRPLPGLPELEEAGLSVLCNGDYAPWQLIRRRLIVGERMGLIPPDAPAVPLQRDLSAEQARLRLRPEPEASTLKLDLRREMHLERSRLLHRLALLDAPWGTVVRPRDQPPGAFVELWRLQWTPELSLRIIQAAPWGNTVRDAAAARVAARADELTELPPLIALVDALIAADLPEALLPLLTRIEALSAGIGADSGHGPVAQMLAALPPLAQALRYGGLRQTAEHLPLLERVFSHLLARACLSLPRVCASLDESAAAEMVERLSAAAPAVRLVQVADAAERWRAALAQLADRPAIHPSIAGRATRLLHDEGAWPAASVRLRLERALSSGDARYAADWLDGLLRDSGLLLVHDRPLWQAVDDWLAGLGEERFRAALPLLRRTFAGYPDGVRTQLLARLSRATTVGLPQVTRFDPARAAAVLPVLGRALGLALNHLEANERTE